MKKILLAVDGSAYAETAARFVSHLPHDEKLELTVLTVLQTPYVNHSYPTAEAIDELYHRDKDAAAETYAKISAWFTGANVTLRHVMPQGHPGQAIVKAAEDEASELVVLGARGRSNISRILLGSTSDYVATHSPCSVLVVRESAASIVDRPLRIAIGYEESGPAQAAMEEIKEIDWGQGVKMDVVSVSPFWYGFFGELRPDSQAEIAVTKAVQEATKQMMEVVPNVLPHVIQSEHVGEGLVQFATDNRSDLLVVGETPRNLVGRILLGSVSRYVLRHAPCSVWITRNRMIEGLAKPTAQAAQSTH